MSEDIEIGDKIGLETEPPDKPITDGQDAALVHLQELAGYLATSSEQAIDSVQLARMGEISDKKRQLADLLMEITKQQAELMLASAMRTMPRQPVSERVNQPAEQPQDGDTNALWFRTRQQAGTEKRKATVSEQDVWAACFATYGCAVCGTKAAEHNGSGLCHRCSERIHARKARIRKRLADSRKER